LISIAVMDYIPLAFGKRGIRPEVTPQTKPIPSLISFAKKRSESPLEVR
jgi:hypothetical protein